MKPSAIIQQLREIRVHPTVFFTSGRNPKTDVIEHSGAPMDIYYVSLQGELRRRVPRRRNRHRVNPSYPRQSGKSIRRWSIQMRRNSFI